jgi:lipopolysaccharide export system protein LptC
MMKDRLPTVASTVILLALVIGTWIAAEHTKRAIVIEPAAKQTHEPDSWGQNIVTVRTNDQGMATSRLLGDYMEHFPDDDSYDVVSPKATNVPDESPLTQATARAATILDDGNRIILKGDAIIRRLPDSNKPEPMVVRSEKITILAAEDVAFTDLPAVAQDGRTRLSGIGMHYDNQTGELRVERSTDVEISPREQEKPAQ